MKKIETILEVLQIYGYCSIQNIEQHFYSNKNTRNNLISFYLKKEYISEFSLPYIGIRLFRLNSKAYLCKYLSGKQKKNFNHNNIKPSQVFHHCEIVNTWLTLKKSGFKNVTPENMIKGLLRRPDLHFEYKDQLVGIENELTVKTKSRYKNILFNYSNNSPYSAVIFITTSELLNRLMIILSSFGSSMKIFYSTRENFANLQLFDNENNLIQLKMEEQ